jgi:hypothetical protein
VRHGNGRVIGAVFGAVAAIVVGILFSSAALMIKAAAGLWLVVLAFVLFAAEYRRDADWLRRMLDRRDGFGLYTRVTQAILRGLGRAMRPDTAEATPPPGWLAWADWITTPRAADAADLERLQRNPWSWPVMDAALRIAVIYPILFAMAGMMRAGLSPDLGMSGGLYAPRASANETRRFVSSSHRCSRAVQMLCRRVMRFLSASSA